MPFKLSQSPEYRNHQLAVGRGRIGPRIAERLEARSLSPIVASVLSKSLVLRASRSSLVTSSTSPASSPASSPPMQRGLS